MAKNDSIKTGVLSFGLSGQVFHCPFVDEHPYFELTAAVERSQKKAKSIYPDIKSYNTVDDLMADKDIELVIVNTPNATHYDFASKALQAKKHVLIEKPFTVTTKQAQHLFALAQENNCKVLPYQNRRYDSDFLSVKSVLSSGKLGKLTECHLRYDRYKLNIGAKLMKESPVPGSGLAYDLGPHLLDGAIALFGLPYQWTKTLRHFRPATQVDDYAYFHLMYPQGFNVFITVSMLVPEPQPAFVLHGTHGSYIKNRADVQEKQLLDGMKPSNTMFGKEPDGHQGILKTIMKDGSKKHEKIFSPQSSYINVFHDVFNTIKKDKPYPVSQNDVLKQLEILKN